MPPITHGNDAFTAFQMSDESAWGTPTGSYVDVPIIRETLHTVRDRLPSSPEFGDLGGETGVDTINPRVEGEITFTPRLDAPWFHWFLGHIFGTEQLDLNTDLDGNTGIPQTGGNGHWYTPSQQYRSLAFRVWKGGASAGGNWSQFVGCIVTSARIELSPDGLLQMTVAVVGKVETGAAIIGSPGVPAGVVGAEALWLTQNGATFKTGSTLAAINVRGFTIEFDRQVAADPSFMNTLSTANEPGPQGNRISRCTIQGLLETTYINAGQPYLEFLNDTASKCRIQIRDSAAASDDLSEKYAMDIDFPSVKWLEGDYSVKEAGSNPTTAVLQGIEAVTTAPATGSADMRVGVYVNDADDIDTYFTVVAGGVTQVTI